jgi:hypothetical protein
MYKKYFCSFADSRMNETLDRIKIQAEELDCFNEIFIRNENDLDSDFREYFKDKLVKGSRGYGYWVWKPQIILQTLKKMHEGDILLYTDAGCHLNKNGKERLDYYFKQTELSKSGLLVFQEAKEADNKELRTSNCLEKFYSKGDIFDYFKVRDKKEVYNTGVMVGGIIFIRKCPKSKEIIEQWLNIFKYNFNLVDNSQSISPNFEGFIENRHDQSIFSFLCKLNDISSISASELWQEDWNKLENYPIHAKRDKKLKWYWRIHRKIVEKIVKYLE